MNRTHSVLTRLRSNSLFLRLVMSFLFIIILLVSLTSYSIYVSKNNIRHEIVKYNTLMLQGTMENYEKHFDMIKKQMYLFYFSDRVQQLQRAPRYSNFPDVRKDIQTWVSNPNLFIDNIVFYSKTNDFVLEKDTSTKPETMFNAFVASERYPLDFWNKQFEETYTNRIYPEDSFYTHIFRGRPVSVGELIPIIFKRADNHDFYMVVFLNAKKMYEAFHQTINEDFTIYSPTGETIFKRTQSDVSLPLTELKTHGDSEFILNDQYYFHRTSEDSGMTYLHRIPVADMTSLTRLNFTMVAIITAVIVFSVFVSLLLAARIHNPFKKLIDSIRGTGDGQPYRSSIQEFDMISRQLRDKQKLQKQWAFIHLLKDIRGQENDAAKLDFSGKTFVFVLFHVVEKNNSLRSHGTFQRWLYYIRVFIEEKMGQSFPDALTFQIEHDQILSLVFIDRLERLQNMLEEMKSVFDQDRDSGTITIAVTSPYEHYGQINEAYKEVLRRVGARRLIDETQIVTSPPQPPVDFGLIQEQDILFRANLKEGNAEALSQLIGRYFERWRGEEVPATAWQRFAEWVTDHIRQAASSGPVNPSKLDDILENAEEKVGRCVTDAELEQLLLHWVKQFCEAIREKRERKDSVTSFIMEYVNDHLADEIYLDVLAEKLNLSSGYLSTYFKDKTGMNFVEYVNETRIKKATSLLIDSRLKIQEVAEAVGYRNITSFNRMFKKYTGLKPSDYRKSGHADPEG